MLLIILHFDSISVTDDCDESDYYRRYFILLLLFKKVAVVGCFVLKLIFVMIYRDHDRIIISIIISIINIMMLRYIDE